MRSIPDPGFPGDTGEADPGLAAELARYDAGGAGDVDVLVALLDARLLVPVVAVAGDAQEGSDMAAVLLTGADGRLALLAFTGTESLGAWDPRARPVPVAARVAARSALQEDAAALVVDVAGPVRFVVDGDDLVGMASGMTLGRVGGRAAWIGRPGESSDSLRR